MKNIQIEEVPLMKIAVSLMGGIVVGQFVAVNVLWLLAGLIVLLVLALLLWRWAQWQSAAIALCFVCLGWLLMQRQKENLCVAWPKGEVCYEAVVISEPIEKPKTMAVDILLPENGRKLKAYLYKDQRSRSLQIGDGLRIQSRIQPNDDWQRGTFDYRRYLETHGFTGRTFIASWKWQKAEISLKGLSRLERTRLFFLRLRHRLLARLNSMEAERDAQSVVAAMALGDKSALTQDLKETYAITGASHVLALSGLHLGIIYSLLMLLFGGRKLITHHLSLITILGVWAFVFLVGMPVSVVRAAMMLSVYALLSLGHRDKMSVNTLAFTALVLLMLHPLSLFDVGFQMSFMAVFSILVWVPLLMSAFPSDYLQSHRVVRWFWAMVAVSVAAQMGVAPLIAYYFGRLSSFFLLTNFIVVPAATLILWLAPFALLFPSFAYILLYIVASLNAALTKIAAIPGASIEGLHPSILQVTMIYVIIAAVYLLILRLRRTASPRREW
ncbi:MAG: ComEC/Rec2 family competence protein [Prevotella sp.]|nr:ComEC/Rec2 family competence protein [Prevotella sp.]